MILNDQSIAEAFHTARLAIVPWHLDHLQPASYEVHLGEPVTLEPGGFRLSHTAEVINLNPEAPICAQLHGKSSLGRIGLLVHATAGFIDPGFCGQLTLELKNLTDEWIFLDEWQAVGQLVFHQMPAPANRPYGHPELGSHYQGQTGTTPSYLSLPART